MESGDFSVEHLAQGARQLRIAVVTETYPPEVNGVAMTTGRLVDGLLRLGHRIELIRPRQGRADMASRDGGLSEILARGMPIPRYHHLKLGLPARAALLAQWTRERPDVVQIVTEGPLGWSAMSAARRLRLPVVSEFHTNFDAYSRYYGLGWLQRSVGAYLRRFHNRGDLTLVPTQAMQAALLRAGYRAVDVVARGVDRTLFNPARRCRELRASWGVGADGLVVAHVGRLAPEKNFALLLRAFDAIAAQRPDAKLLLVGDGPARKQLEARAHPRIVFAGMRAGEDLARHYASSDVFLFPSITETFGNVTSEALASGLPVIAYDYAAAAELLRHEHNGMRVPFGDESAFIAQALAACDGARLARLRDNAAPSVAHLDWGAVVARLVEKLDGVIARNRRHAAGPAALPAAVTSDG